MVRTLKEKEREEKKENKLKEKEINEKKRKYREEKIKIEENIKKLNKEKKEEILKETEELEEKLNEVSLKRSSAMKIYREKLKKDKIEIIERINKEYEEREKVEEEKLEKILKLIEEINDYKKISKVKLIENEESENEIEDLDEYLNELDVEEPQFIEKSKIIIKKLNEDNGEIENIIQLADIHIYLSKRHDEYQEVFNKLYEKLENYKLTNPKTIIVICGDLMETKDKLDGNTVIFTLEFLKSLSKIFPLILIAGNHDCVKGSDKIDTITAIIKERKIQDFYYLLDTGIYIYKNIIFGLSSIKDKYILSNEMVLEVFEEEKIDLKYSDDKIKRIGLYHGQINNATTLNPEYVPKKTVSKSLNLFGNYDYILLGDIHKFQYLNAKKTAAYSGSLISQSYSETDDYHGYLEWNILREESKYIKIENKKAYYEINIEEILEDDKIMKISKEKLKDKVKGKEEGYVRILIPSANYRKYPHKYISDQITNVYKNLSVKCTEKKVKEYIQLKSNEDEIEIKNNDIGIEILLNEYTNKNILDIEEIYKKKAINIFLDLLNKNTNIKYSKSDWRILLLKFDNMFIYGQGNIIEFKDEYLDNVVGIIGDNAIGKSFIIDIITVMLYGTSARDGLKGIPKDIINKSHKSANGILIFESDGKLYLIKRKIYRDLTNDLDLYELIPSEKAFEQIKENESIIFKGEKYYFVSQKIDKVDTKTQITMLVGPYEHFLNSSVLLQGNNKTFKSKTNLERKKTISEMLNLNYGPTLIKEISEKYNDLKKNVEKIKENLGKYIISNKKQDNDTFIKNIIDIHLISEKEKLLDLIESNNLLIEKRDNNQNELKKISKEIYNSQLQIINSNEILVFESNLNTENIEKKYTNERKRLEERLLEIEKLSKQLDVNLLSNKEKIIYEYSNINVENNLSQMKKMLESKKYLSEDYKSELYDEELKSLNIKIKRNEKTLLKYCKSNEVEKTLEKIDNDLLELNINKNNKQKEIINTDTKLDDEKIKLKNIKKKIKEITMVLNEIEENEIYNNGEDIKNNYDMLMKNNQNFLDSTIDSIQNKLTNKDYKPLNELFSNLKDSINIILKRNDNNTIIKEYDELILLENNYDEKYSLYTDLVESKKIIQNNIDIINNNNEHLIDIENIDEQIETCTQEKNIIFELITEQNKLTCDKNNLITNNTIYNNNLQIDLEVNKIYEQNTVNEIIVNNYLKLQEELKNQEKYTLETVSIKKLISHLEYCYNCSINNNNLRIRIDDIKNKQDQINDENINLYKTILNNEKLIQSFNDKIKSIEDCINEYHAIKEDYHIYYVLNKFITGDAIQNFILSNSIGTINNKINNIVKDYIENGKQIKIFFDNNNNIDIAIEFNNQLIYSVSGMEAFIVDLAFKIAMLDISELPKSNMLFIDESISVLDKKRISTIDSLFLFIIQHYNSVFLITHLENVADIIRFNLDIQHNLNKSFINNTNSNYNIIQEHSLPFKSKSKKNINNSI